MALRSRPLRFSLWKVTHLQQRSCRSRIESRVADHGCADRRHLLSLGSTDFSNSTSSLPSSETTPLRESLTQKEKQKDDVQLAIVPFCCREIQLQAWKAYAIGKPSLVNTDVTTLLNPAESKLDLCDIYPENHIASTSKDDVVMGAGQHVWPYAYTADDILYGKHNALVHSATLRVDPLFVAEFFKRKPVLTEKTETSKEVSAPNIASSPQTLAPSLATSEVDGESETESPLVSDFVYSMEYFMNGAFSLEKEDETHCPLPVTNPAERSPVESLNPRSPIPGVMYYGDLPGSKETPKKQLPDRRERPSMQQLVNMQDYLSETLPRIFVKRHDYRIYSQDIIFENNYFEKPYITTGLNNYAVQLAKLRIMAHFRFANVRLHLLKATVHEEDGSVRIRWRLSGIPQARAIMFWRFLPWRFKDKVNKESEWHDGFSTFYLDGQGMIAKHKMERVMPEEEVVVKKEAAVNEELNPGLAA